MSTWAIQVLKQRKIPFEVIKYDHGEKGAAFAARATGFPLHQIVKTLVVELVSKNHVLALMPGDRQLSLKKTAAACRAKKAAMADTATAQRLTGYLVGGISPFGTTKQLPVVMEKDILACDTIVINAGQRGMMLKLHPNDVATETRGTVADITDRNQ